MATTAHNSSRLEQLRASLGRQGNGLGHPTRPIWSFLLLQQSNPTPRLGAINAFGGAGKGGAGGVAEVAARRHSGRSESRRDAPQTWADLRGFLLQLATLRRRRRQRRAQLGQLRIGCGGGSTRVSAPPANDHRTCSFARTNKPPAVYFRHPLTWPLTPPSFIDFPEPTAAANCVWLVDIIERKMYRPPVWLRREKERLVSAELTRQQAAFRVAANPNK